MLIPYRPCLPSR